MSRIVYRITDLLYSVVASLPIGTNLGVFVLLWTFLSGRLLESRGAVIPALDAFGLSEEEVRRAWASLRYGKWKIQPLLDAWHKRVRVEGIWQPHRYGKYRVLACDWIGFYRPRLKDCATKHYDSNAGKSLPAIPLGALVSVGSVGSQRLGLLRTLVRPEAKDPSEAALKRATLKAVAERMQPAGIRVVADRPHHIVGEVAVDRERDRLRDPVVQCAVPAHVAGLGVALRRRPVADRERPGDARDQPTRRDLPG